MAGTNIALNVEYDDSQLQKHLQKLHRLSGDMSPAMLEISEYLHESTDNRFDQQEAPDGTPWATLTPTTLALRDKPNMPILQQSLSLKGHLVPDHSDTHASLSTGPGTVYAAMMQFGGKTSPNSMIPGVEIPARPYLGLSDADEQEIIGIIHDHIERNL